MVKMNINVMIVKDALEALRDPEEAERNSQGHDEDEEYEEQY